MLNKMANNVFPEIIFRDGRWFLTGISSKFPVSVELPNNPMMNRIWEVSSNLLNVYIDDCGANLDRCVETLRSASIAFAGISQLLADEAKKTQEDIDLDNLYNPSDNEPWWNK